MNNPNITWDTDKDIGRSLVTVVTPTYNRGDLLVQAVTSVTRQTYPHIEHIIVGDNCPVLGELREKLLSINPLLRVYNLSGAPQITYGPARIARLRNSGINLANGEFIAHLDDDNTFALNHIESLIDGFRHRPDAAVAHSYRKLLVNGVHPYVLPFHPWSSDIDTAGKVYSTYHRMGIYRSGSHHMRDRVTFHEERNCTLDTNELMVRREIHAIFPFVEKFTVEMIQQEMGEDDIFCEMVYQAGYRFTASGEFSLNFCLGGRFTKKILAAIQAKNSDRIENK